MSARPDVVHDLVKGKEGFEMKDLVGNVAVAVTIALFCSGIFICKEIQRRGIADEISPLPFLTALVSCTVWFCYGVSTGDASLCIVNGVGGILQLLYLIYYYFMSPNKRGIQKKLAVVGGILAVVFSIIYIYREDVETLTQILGVIASSCTLVFMGSPLSEIVNVCRTKSTKTLPFPLIVTSFLVALLWSIYGILIQDRVVQIPNMVGTFITLIQLSMFLIFQEQQKTSI